MRKNLIVIVLIFVVVVVTMTLINYQRERNQITAIINLLQQYQTLGTSQEKKQALTDAVVSYRQNLPIKISLSFSQAEERQSKEWCDNLWIVIQNVVAQIDAGTILEMAEGGPGSVEGNVYVDSMNALIKFWLDNGCFYYD